MRALLLDHRDAALVGQQRSADPQVSWFETLDADAVGGVRLRVQPGQRLEHDRAVVAGLARVGPSAATNRISGGNCTVSCTLVAAFEPWFTMRIS